MRRKVAIALCLLCLVGCRGPKEIYKEVPVYVHDTVHEWHTNNVVHHDTVESVKETIIREADSSLLAAYGVVDMKVKDNERIILVLRRELQQKTEYISAMESDSSVMATQEPVVITEKVEVEKEPNLLQRLLMGIGMAAVAAAIACIVFKVARWRQG